MKILFIQKFGFGRFSAADAFFIPMTLAKLGHEVTLVVQSDNVVESMLQQGVDVVYVLPNQSWNLSLRQIVARKKPDIIHVFMHLGCGVYPFILKKECKPIFVLDIRSPLLWTGFLKQCIRLKNQMEILGFDLVTAHAIRSAHTVIGKRHPVQWIPPGVDFDLLKTPLEKMNWQEKNIFKAVYIGNLDQKRQIINLLEAAILASVKIPLQLDIYGTGNGESAIIEYLKRKNVKNIRLMGLLPRSTLFEKLGDYDIGISYVPARFYEMAPPLKAVEYLASGLPVLATDTIGNSIFVRSQVNGLLVAEDPISFAEGIENIARASWLSAARSHARFSVEQYDWKKIVMERLLPQYSNALKKRRSVWQERRSNLIRFLRKIFLATQ